MEAKEARDDVVDFGLLKIADESSPCQLGFPPRGRHGRVGLLAIMARFNPAFVRMLIHFLRFDAQALTVQVIEKEHHKEIRAALRKQGVTGADMKAWNLVLEPVGRDEYSKLWGPGDADIFERGTELARIHGMERLARVLERSAGELTNRGAMPFDVLHRIPQIAETIIDELDEMALHWINPRHADLFEAVAPFGENVDRVFPQAAGDIREAANCLAVERYTAAVFHLMRVLEGGLAALAHELELDDVRSKNPNWQNVLDAVEKKCRQLDQQPKTPEVKQRLQGFAEAAAHLRTFKNAWRNKTPHDLDAVYTEQQAEDIWNAVRPFMQGLAGWLRERGIDQAG